MDQLLNRLERFSTAMKGATQECWVIEYSEFRDTEVAEGVDPARIPAPAAWMVNSTVYVMGEFIASVRLRLQTGIDELAPGGLVAMNGDEIWTGMKISHIQHAHGVF